MSEFEDDLRKTLGENGPFDPQKVDRMKREVTTQYTGWLARIERWLYVWLIGLAALLVFAAVRFEHSTDTKALMQYGVLILIGIVGQALIKLWYWLMNNKIGVLKELKLLRLDLAAIPGADKAFSRIDIDDLMRGPPRRVAGCGKVERVAWKIALFAVIVSVGLASGCELTIGRFSIGRWQPVAQPPRRMVEVREHSEAALFEGNINAVSADRTAVVLIVPTNEPDKDVQARIHEYVKAIRDKFFQSAPVLTDDEALKRDLSSNALFVYGTPAGNRWLAQHIDKLPIRVEADKIVAGEVHPGTDLRCITAWPNPQDPRMGVAIYTAQRAKDIIEINAVFHGPTDYVIARGTTILEEDFYEKRDGQWLLYLGEPADEESAEPSAAAIPIDVSVDARVELVSLIFRLAGNREYNMCKIPSYDRDMQAHFRPHGDHPAVQLAAELKSSRGVSFDAPMSLAVHLTDVDTLGEKIPFDSADEEIDSRWKLDEAREFVHKARQFVQDTNFNEFIDAHRELYARTIDRAKELLRRRVRFEWFDEFFGERPGASFNVIIGMLNGPSNYGARIKLGDKEELYCILGVWDCDLTGVPRFPSAMAGTIVHEFCHSYVNPLVYAHASELEQAGTRMFPRVKDRMKSMAYGNWQTMMHESVVRASVVRYLRATNGAAAARKQVKREINNGFLWMQELAELLEQYEADRERYPTFESFFSRIIEFFEAYSENLERI